MRMPYHHLCEAGIKGGNSEFARKSRRTELSKDRRRTHVRTVVTQPGLKQVKWPAQKRERTENEIDLSRYLRYLRKVPADSEILNLTSNENQERDNSDKALRNSEQAVSCKLYQGRIVPEANALGKAEGYADGDTVK